MSEVVMNAGLILLFILIGGVFAAAEMSLVSLRDSQIRALSKRGKRGRVVARLTEDPNRFLSAVQVGVTLSGFLSAAFGGATLAAALAPVLERVGLSAGAADTVALILITVVISYVSIVLGELTAKRLALQRSEGFALALAPVVNFIATLARPVIWLLGVSTNVVVRVLGGDPRAGREEVSDEEIRALVSSSTTLGDEERRIVHEVFAAGSRGMRDVMIPRTEVRFLSGEMLVADARKMITDMPHSRYPVTGESADDVLGFVHIRDLFSPAARLDQPISTQVRPIVAVPDTLDVLAALSHLRRTSGHLAIVVDEYGGTAGIVTIEDLVEELVGEINDEYDEPAKPVDPGEPDVFDLDGLTTVDDFAQQARYLLPKGRYHTLAGFVMSLSPMLPTVGTEVSAVLHPLDDEGADSLWTFVVIGLDGRRLARIRATRASVDTLADAALV